MMEPIVVEFEVACSPDHAFEVWTQRAELWWPRSHTVTQDEKFDVVFEPRVGGRIYEVGVDGAEHEWGEVVVWSPPHRVEYLWHLFFDRSEATDIVLTFEAVAAGTMVRLIQTGFDRLPTEVGTVRRGRTEVAWGEVTAPYREVVTLS